MSSEVRRKLTTILAADAEGYSRIMEADEVRGVDALRRARDVFSKLIERHAGRIANTAGDGLIAEFPSVVEAVQCAIEVQTELTRDGQTPGGAMQFRIGIHLGDVILDGDDLLGEGVNLAARLQSMAEPGGILISRQVYDQVHAKLSVGFDYIGEKRPKNFSQDVSVYRVTSQQDVRRLRPNVKVAKPTDTGANAETETVSTVSPNSRLAYYGKRAGVICAVLLVVDIFTGEPFWAHFPSVIILAVLGWVAVPRDGWGRLGVWPSRAVILVVALALINIATWNGTLWVAWPAGLLVALCLWRRVTRTTG